MLGWFLTFLYCIFHMFLSKVKTYILKSIVESTDCLLEDK